jgi:hypothetical protein
LGFGIGVIGEVIVGEMGFDGFEIRHAFWWLWFRF